MDADARGRRQPGLKVPTEQGGGARRGRGVRGVRGASEVLVLGRGVGAMVGHVALQSQARWRRA